MDKKEGISIIQIAQGFFVMNMLIWLVIGGISLARLDDGMESPVFLVVALMLLGNAVLMGLAAWLLGKRTIWTYLFAISLLGVNVITTFTDQVGFFDYATLLVDVILLLLLIFKRDEFVGSRK